LFQIENAIFLKRVFSALRYSRIWKQRPDYECAEMI